MAPRAAPVPMRGGAHMLRTCRVDAWSGLAKGAARALRLWPRSEEPRLAAMRHACRVDHRTDHLMGDELTGVAGGRVNA